LWLCVSVETEIALPFELHGLLDTGIRERRFKAGSGQHL
jgi:hypothetical protein